jgi:small ligand-binding sensory domain FIST
MHRYAASLSLHPDPAEALGEVAGHVLERLGPEPDLVVLFASPHHVDAFADIASGVRALVAPRMLAGATAVAVAGGGREVEGSPAVSLWAARFAVPGVGRTVRLDVEDAPDGARVVGWPDDLPGDGTMLLLADPLTFPVAEVLELLNEHAPGLAIVGGLASAALRPGGNRLAADDTVTDRGAVGVLLDERLAVATVVSQGCRPVGRPYTVTRAERNLVYELGGRPPIERLQELIAALDPDDQQLVRQGLHVGLVVDEHVEDFRRGDFLVRNVVGADQSTGALAVGERIEVGQTLQFHVRDAASADQDLRALLRGVDAGAALLFTCNGRGTHLFGVPDHDAGTIDELLGPLPLAGAFCAGEIGPVGGRNHLHGFTASVAVFP